jgi:dTDP-L-rhamnose 4-epimerase
MKGKILITGGAGFIGSHLADELLRQGYPVRALDVLTPQVHPEGRPPDYLDPEVELMVGDVRDPQAVRRALQGVDGVFHLAAAVGVGQSMYQIQRYVDVNDLGTATLLEALSQGRRVQRLVVASSMSVYGEGEYVDESGARAIPQLRPAHRLREGDWDVRDASGQVLRPVPTSESKATALTSVYAICKFAQERLCRVVGEAYDIPVIALRFFNVYGSRQALSNPYTGVLAIFAARLLNGRRPMVYEDGGQQRDFVSVYDIAHACQLALEAPPEQTGVFNIGSGSPISIAGIAQRLAAAMNVSALAPEITHTYRKGDIRHCFADITRARELLGYEPQVDLETGLAELAAWLEGQSAEDLVDSAHGELAARGLTL